MNFPVRRACGGTEEWSRGVMGTQLQHSNTTHNTVI